MLVKTTRIIVIILLFLTSINALISGALFINDPSGNSMGMSNDYLKTSPFTSFLIPGIVLFIVNGLLTLFAGIAMVLRKSFSALWVIIQGIILIGWILIQMMMVNDINKLHIVMLIIGVLFVIGGSFIRQSE